MSRKSKSRLLGVSDGEASLGNHQIQLENAPFADSAVQWAPLVRHGMWLLFTPTSLVHAVGSNQLLNVQCRGLVRMPRRGGSGAVSGNQCCHA